jgi:hypothetical protein
VLSCPSGWFNPCDLLDAGEPSPRIYARGFPYSQRDGSVDGAGETVERAPARVRINAGLWSGDPDVDAVTRLALQPTVQARDPRAVVLERGTWAPVNSQNTALHRDAIPAYYFVRMGYPLFGQRVDRFGDIFSGYFVQACAKHLGDAVRFGDPVTRHLRNDHALLTDLVQELPGILAVEDLLDWLRECRLEGATYADAYRSLSHALDEVAEELAAPRWTPDARGFLHQTAHLMRRWLDAVERAAP